MTPKTVTVRVMTNKDRFFEVSVTMMTCGRLVVVTRGKLVVTRGRFVVTRRIRLEVTRIVERWWLIIIWRLCGFKGGLNRNT